MEHAPSFTDDMKSDLLLENATISDIDKRMILNALENKTPFEEIKRALAVQHANIHLRNKPCTARLGLKGSIKGYKGSNTSG